MADTLLYHRVVMPRCVAWAKLKEPPLAVRCCHMANSTGGDDRGGGAPPPCVETCVDTGGCCAGNVARAADNPAATAAHTSPPAPFLVSASRHAHSVQGLLEAMALQRMVELSQQAPATTAGERHGP